VSARDVLAMALVRHIEGDDVTRDLITDDEWAGYLSDADYVSGLISAAGYAVCDKAILQIALLVLCAAEKGQDWNPNFRKDITCAIDGLRAILARINGEAGR